MASRTSGRPLRNPITASGGMHTVPTEFAASAPMKRVGPSAARTSASAIVAQRQQRNGKRKRSGRLAIGDAPVHLAVDHCQRAFPRQAVDEELVRLTVIVPGV